MVRAWFPQGRNKNLDTNSDYPPQNFMDGGGPLPPIGDDELIEETLGIFSHLLYDEGAGSDGFVLIEET